MPGFRLRESLFQLGSLLLQSQELCFEFVKISFSLRVSREGTCHEQQQEKCGADETCF